MLAVQVAGATIGNMICINNILVSNSDRHLATAQGHTMSTEDRGSFAAHINGKKISEHGNVHGNCCYFGAVCIYLDQHLQIASITDA
jgi:hypothetical protein